MAVVVVVQQALALVASGRAFSGVLRLNPFNHRSAYVTPARNVLGTDILIDGVRHR